MTVQKTSDFEAFWISDIQMMDAQSVSKKWFIKPTSRKELIKKKKLQ
jgi:hypothetical protein